MSSRVHRTFSSAGSALSSSRPVARIRVTWCSVCRVDSARLRSVMSIVVPRHTPPSPRGSSSFALVSAQRSVPSCSRRPVLELQHRARVGGQAQHVAHLLPVGRMHRRQ
jgi:hypothetical protein